MDKRWIWIFLGIFSLFLRFIFGANPEWAEVFYSRGVFIGVRRFINYTLALSPVAVVYFLVAGLSGALLYYLFKGWSTRSPIKERMKNGVLNFLSFLGIVVTLFLWLWGYNYARPSIESKLGLEAVALSREALKKELLTYTDIIEELRGRFSGKVENNAPAIDELEIEVRDALKKVLSDMGYPVPGEVRGRIIHPKGILMRFSASGIYLPFTGEGHVDSGLHSIQIPFVLAHEMAHGYGIADEGTCNFLAFLACETASSEYVQYSGYLSYWRYLAGSYRRLEPELYKIFRDCLPGDIINDLNAINAAIEKYPDFIPQWRDLVYDNFLKAQGVSEGVLSYSKIILLVTAWKKKQEKGL